MNRFLEILWEYKLFILLLIVVVVFLILYVDPSAFTHETKDYELVDNCGQGPSGLGIQHTIMDQGACETQCFGTCESNNMNVVGASFSEKAQGECNLCSCVCG
ncbi:MAG: hypothetical protein GXP63_01830 [DPANN group archaeon]|nr:hypothetical protein [DPANN group archaeon]